MPARAPLALLSLCLLAVATAGASTAARPSSAQAGANAGVTLVVLVTGAVDPRGLVGAALHASAQTFPDDLPPTNQQRPRSAAATVDTFVFRDVTPGRYALAARHDLNGNGTVDRNLVGIPKEPWGVSRNVRHALRAPRFDEAAFEVRADTTITVQVAR
ncbi:DUF2141 domain-containing protein [Gemmatimonas sp.]|jgi:uncharacterized protein (DUF2141 family)|uniref:DUF2141 domain-containing protein n=1 Tax=Gemmatimonas sp. TaxID=1962908 RepID=UPI0037BEEB56